MTDGLKPCPFCGGEAKTRLNDRWWIHCGNCTCEIGFEGMDENGYYGHFDTEAEVIAAWNARAERTCRMEYQTEGMQRGWWKCSECGEAMDTIEACGGRKPPRWCGNCGAKVIE